MGDYFAGRGRRRNRAEPGPLTTGIDPNDPGPEPAQYQVPSCAIMWRRPGHTSTDRLVSKNGWNRAIASVFSISSSGPDRQPSRHNGDITRLFLKDAETRAPGGQPERVHSIGQPLWPMMGALGRLLGRLPWVFLVPSLSQGL